MRRKFLRVLVAALVASVGFAMVVPATGAQTPPPDTTATSTPAAPKTVTVAVKDNFYSPKKVAVAVGDKVTWKWKGFSIHDVKVVKGPQKFESKKQSSGTFSRVIKKPGAYRIVCTLHPGMEMSLKAT
jgi:plastocyanin